MFLVAGNVDLGLHQTCLYIFRAGLHSQMAFEGTVTPPTKDSVRLTPCTGPRTKTKPERLSTWTARNRTALPDVASQPGFLDTWHRLSSPLHSFLDGFWAAYRLLLGAARFHPDINPQLARIFWWTTSLALMPPRPPAPQALRRSRLALLVLQIWLC